MAKTGRRKKRTHVKEHVDTSKKGDPKTFVFTRGKNALTLLPLQADLRKMFQPNTAINLRENKKNTMKDFLDVAGPLGVTHFVLLTATSKSCNMKVVKIPKGPTVTLRIHEYSLMRDVISAQARPSVPDSMWKSPPLVVLNAFTAEEHLQLVAALFQNLFPAINVRTVKLSSCQRVVLLNHDRATGRISLRHYLITAKPSGASKSVKALLARKLPDLSALEDVAEFITRSGYGSESEGEDAAEARVELAQDLGHGNLASRQSRVCLQEVGPRLELEVVKVEEGFCGGKVLHHTYVTKTLQEASAQQSAKEVSNKEAEQREKERAARRRQQEENVAKKASAKKRAGEAAAAASGKKRRQKQWWEKAGEGQQRLSDDDDNEHFRQEVGEEPDEFLRPAKQMKERHNKK